MFIGLLSLPLFLVIKKINNMLSERALKNIIKRLLDFIIVKTPPLIKNSKQDEFEKMYLKEIEVISEEA